jgi:hypothetical protein
MHNQEDTARQHRYQYLHMDGAEWAQKVSNNKRATGKKRVRCFRVQNRISPQNICLPAINRFNTRTCDQLRGVCAKTHCMNQLMKGGGLHMGKNAVTYFFYMHLVVRIHRVGNPFRPVKSTGRKGRRQESPWARGHFVAKRIVLAIKTDHLFVQGTIYPVEGKCCHPLAHSKRRRLPKEVQHPSRPKIAIQCRPTPYPRWAHQCRPDRHC